LVLVVVVVSAKILVSLISCGGEGGVEEGQEGEESIWVIMTGGGVGVTERGASKEVADEIVDSVDGESGGCCCWF
jgi:hypothetical protein